MAFVDQPLDDISPKPNRIFLRCRNKVNRLIEDAKKEFYTSKINDKPTDQKNLFSWANKLLHISKTSPLPTDVSDKCLSDKMATFFKNKIDKIREELEVLKQSSEPNALEESHTLSANQLLTFFETVSETEIQKIIMSSASKSSCLDPLPTSLLKECLHELLPTITNIINKSLTSSTVPDIMKKAAILPILKKHNLDSENLNNYHPISNLSFVSNTLEKVVAKRLDTHLTKNNLHEPSQSAYKKFHSTETALLKVQNYILLAMDNQKCVVLVLLDLSAAFDTVDHHVLLERLRNSFGVEGSANDWFTSYLKNRRKTVIVTEHHQRRLHQTVMSPKDLFLAQTFSSHMDIHWGNSFVLLALTFIFMPMIHNCIWCLISLLIKLQSTKLNSV